MDRDVGTDFSFGEPGTYPDWIKGFGIDWAPNFDNHPSYYVLVDKPPKLDMRFTVKDGVWLGTDGSGVCELHFHSGPTHVDEHGVLHTSRQEGYGGRGFELTMVDGTKAVLHGPWHGCAEGAEAAGFEPVVEMRMRTRDGSGYFGYYVTYPCMAAILKDFDPHRRFRRFKRGYSSILPLTRQGFLKEDVRNPDRTSEQRFLNLT